MKRLIWNYVALTLFTACGAIKNNCDVNGYNELCYGLLGDYRDGKNGQADRDWETASMLRSSK